MKETERRAFDRFLRQLRAGGRTNMYGAVPYVMKAFGVDRNTAFTVVCEWLDRHQEPVAVAGNRITSGQRKPRRRT